jgi:hypothetical protein
VKDKAGLMVAIAPEGEEPDGDEGDYEPDGVESAAGERFAAAVKSGDGAAIYRTFERLSELCELRGSKPKSEE